MVAETPRQGLRPLPVRFNNEAVRVQRRTQPLAGAADRRARCSGRQPKHQDRDRFHHHNPPEKNEPGTRYIRWPLPLESPLARSAGVR